MSNEVDASHIGKMIEVRDEVNEPWVERKYAGYSRTLRAVMCLAQDELLVPWAHARPIQEKKRIPMSPTTCPKFPWAICKAQWGEGEYQAVTVVEKGGIETEKVDFTWIELMDENWLDYATGKPLCFEGDA